MNQASHSHSHLGNWTATCMRWVPCHTGQLLLMVLLKTRSDVIALSSLGSSAKQTCMKNTRESLCRRIQLGLPSLALASRNSQVGSARIFAGLDPTWAWSSTTSYRIVCPAGYKHDGPLHGLRSLTSGFCNIEIDGTFPLLLGTTAGARFLAILSNHPEYPKHCMPATMSMTVCFQQMLLYNYIITSGSRTKLSCRIPPCLPAYVVYLEATHPMSYRRPLRHPILPPFRVI
jgi:hypothetical protein